MRVFLALVGGALAACGGEDPPPTPDAAPTEPPELAGITQLHNDVRAMVATADPLPPLVWSPKLAATAAAWVATCRDQLAPTGLLDHNQERSMGHAYYVGENIFGASGPPSSSTPRDAVMAWAAESANYDHAANTCNGTCGHYTQIVWRATTEIGCAVGDCSSLTFRRTLVCNYGPGGNVGNERPY
jgi:uncharacterized protein YkwD